MTSQSTDMNTYAVLLRGINVGGRNKVPMAQLKDILQQLGYTNVTTYIASGSLQAGDQIPSSTQLVKFYQVNHLTVLKGMNMLADEGIVFKKRGVGMFVADDARQKLLMQRREHLVADYVRPLLREADYLGIPLADLTALVTSYAQEEHYEK